MRKKQVSCFSYVSPNEFLEYEYFDAANSNTIWIQFQNSIEQNTTSESSMLWMVFFWKFKINQPTNDIDCPNLDNSNFMCNSNITSIFTENLWRGQRYSGSCRKEHKLSAYETNISRENQAEHEICLRAQT